MPDARPEPPRLLRELRALLEHEITLHGPLVPLPPEDAAPAPAAEAPADTRADAPSSPEPPPSTTTVPAEATAKPPNDEAPTDEDEANPQPSPPNPQPGMPNFDLFGEPVDPAEDASLPPWERIQSLIPEDAPFRDMETLAEVEAWMNDTVLVPIDAQRENAVFGVGNPDAGLVVIGEAPGANEDKQGEPFVGRAGQLLDKILEAISFEREDIYITNILKSRPPQNRDPQAEEVEAHLPVLYKQIELIRPAILLAVGKVAGNTLLDRRSSLGSLRQQEHDFYGLPLIVTYHPAALLRNPQWKRPTWEDVKLLRTRYDQLTQEA
jgi:DNA polymerase